MTNQTCDVCEGLIPWERTQAKTQAARNYCCADCYEFARGRQEPIEQTRIRWRQKLRQEKMFDQFIYAKKPTTEVTQ